LQKPAFGWTRTFASRCLPIL